MSKEGRHKAAHDGKQKPHADYGSIAHLCPRLDGNHTVRLLVGPQEMVDLPEGSGDYDFAITVIGTSTTSKFALFADLQKIVNGTFAGITIVSTLVLDCEDQEPVSEGEATSLGKWAAHSLYDLATMNLRAAVINNPIVHEFDLPMEPEDPEVLVIFKDKEESDSDSS